VTGPTQQPSVGRVVHYVSHGTPVRPDGTQAFTSQCRAALVTDVHGMAPVPEHGVPYVSLAVFSPEGMYFNRHVLFDESGEQGATWHWPERVS
jgi:hypothetical protein